MSLQAVVVLALKVLTLFAFALGLALLLRGFEARGLGKRSRSKRHAARHEPPPQLPAWVAQSVLLVVGSGLALLIARESRADLHGAELTTRAVVLSQLAIVGLWALPAAIARHHGSGFGWTRFIAYAGVAAHVAVFMAALHYRCTTSAPALRDAGYRGGSLVVSALCLLGAIYFAYAIRNRRSIALPALDHLRSVLRAAAGVLRDQGSKPAQRVRLERAMPLLSLLPSVLMLASLPFGDTLCFELSMEGQADYSALGRFATKHVCRGNGAVALQVSGLDLLPMLGIWLLSLMLCGAVLPSWLQSSPVAAGERRRSSLRLGAGALSLVLGALGVAMVARNTTIAEIVRWQTQQAWGLFVQPLGFVVFLGGSAWTLEQGFGQAIRSLRELRSDPGVSAKATWLAFTESVATVALGALGATIFLGGWHVPLVQRDGVLVRFGQALLLRQAMPQLTVISLGALAFAAKTWLLARLLLALRLRVGRLSPALLQHIVVRRLVPGSLLNLALTWLACRALDSGGSSVTRSLAPWAHGSMVLLAVACTLGALYAMIRFVIPTRRMAPSSNVLDAREIPFGSQ